MIDNTAQQIISPVNVNYKGPGGEAWCPRLDGQWAALFDTNQWCWEYVQGWQMHPSFFKLRYVRITSPNRPEATLLNQTVNIFVSDHYDREKIMAAEVVSAAGGFALSVGSIPYGLTPTEILEDLKNKTVMDISNRFREYWFHAPEKWDGKTANAVRSLLWVDDSGKPVIGAWHTKDGRGDGNIKKTLEAYDHARQTRFEWGQNGYVNN